MSNWQRWLRYGRAKLDSVLEAGNDDLTRREAELEAEAAEKPWLRDSAAAPSLDDVRARIEHDAADAKARSSAEPPHAAGTTTPTPEVGPGFDFAEQQRQADERLAAIRSELGLSDESHGDDEPPPPAGSDGDRR